MVWHCIWDVLDSGLGSSRGLGPINERSKSNTYMHSNQDADAVSPSSHASHSLGPGRVKSPGMLQWQVVPMASILLAATRLG